MAARSELAVLRFSDHRGLNPGEVTFREGSFHARLTRSKTIGQDKTITSKPLVIDACCFLLIVNGSREAGHFFKAWQTSLATTSCQDPHHIARAAESWSSGMMQRLPCRTEFFACLPGMLSQFSTLRQRVFGHLTPAAHSSQVLQQLWGSQSPRGDFLGGRCAQGERQIRQDCDSTYHKHATFSHHCVAKSGCGSSCRRRIDP